MERETEERWQRNITCFRQGIGYLYHTKEFTDASIWVRDYCFKVHKLVLAARSSEFARIFLSPNAPDELIVDKESLITKDGMEILLRFIYLDVLNTDDKRLIIEGYWAGKHYKQKVLQSKCEEIFKSWTINADEVCNLLDIGFDIPAINDKCISFIQSNVMEVISSDSFENASFKSLCAIMKSGALENLPVMQRIEHIMRWEAIHQESTPVNYSLIRQELESWDKKLKLNFLSTLGFEKLCLEDISVVLQKYPGLLKNDEVAKLVLYHGTKDTRNLPEWKEKTDFVWNIQ